MSGKKRAAQKEPSGRRPLRFVLITVFAVCLLGGVVAVLAVAGFYFQIERSLPSGEALKNYHPPLASSVYASDGTLIGEFFIERRYTRELKDMPPYLIKAFLAAEDVRFYEHGGVDLVGIFRATVRNLQAGEIVQGGSTITQQVVKSLLLTSERTYVRKLKEAILAYRIDHTLSKDQILYLYLNQIYFGSGAYGVEAAARTYFDKSTDELTLPESALLAGLPKAPSRFSPLQHFAMARQRQHYVLQRMAEVGFISKEDAKQAFDTPLELVKPKRWTLKELDYFTEEVRRQVEARYGKDGLYKEGLEIHTTLDPRAQELGRKVLDQGLRELDKRHRSYRGTHVNVPKDGWPSALKVVKENNGALESGKVVSALVTAYDDKTKTCQLDLGNGFGRLPASGWQWAKAAMKKGGALFKTGDLIRVRVDKVIEGNTWSTVLEQEPGVEGALMVMSPISGKVFAMVGGRDFSMSQFNRCTQAVRQPGSSFKPLIYAAALDKGYTQSSILIDTPLALPDRAHGLWKPENYDREFWGPIPLRRALVNSRNVVTVKLLNAIGVDYAIGYARHLGIASTLTPTLALALGASGVTMTELLTAYTSFAHQGERVEPYLIERIYDRRGELLEEHQSEHEQVISPQTAYVMTNLLQGVVQEGTARKAKELGRPAAGKTGTTNELKDAWFIGYTPSVLAGVWVGYDDHNVSLGRGETGGHAACPIWLQFMKDYLKDRPVENFPIPDGIVFAKINSHSGAVTRPDDPQASYAAFSGEPPKEGPQVMAEDPITSEVPTAVSSAYPSTSDSASFFKSDLF